MAFFDHLFLCFERLCESLFPFSCFFAVLGEFLFSLLEPDTQLTALCEQVQHYDELLVDNLR